MIQVIDDQNIDHLNPASSKVSLKNKTIWSTLTSIDVF